MAASKSVTYRKGMIAAVNYFLKVRGGNIVMCIQKTNKSHGHQYCTSYCSILYDQTGTREFGAQDDSTIPQDFRNWRHPIFFSITPFFPEIQKVIGGGEFAFPCHSPNHIRACTSLTWEFFVHGRHGILEAQSGPLDRHHTQSSYEGCERFILSEEKAWQKGFPKYLHYACKHISCITCDTL